MYTPEPTGVIVDVGRHPQNRADSGGRRPGRRITSREHAVFLLSQSCPDLTNRSRVRPFLYQCFPHDLPASRALEGKSFPRSRLPNCSAGQEGTPAQTAGVHAHGEVVPALP